MTAVAMRDARVVTIAAVALIVAGLLGVPWPHAAAAAVAVAVVGLVLDRIAALAPRAAPLVIRPEAQRPSEQRQPPPEPRPGHARAGVDKLTSRELEVAVEIARGSTYKEIAGKLNIKYDTVETYVAHIKDKLTLYSKAEIAAWAARAGLLDAFDDPARGGSGRKTP